MKSTMNPISWFRGADEAPFEVLQSAHIPDKSLIVGVPEGWSIDETFEDSEFHFRFENAETGAYMSIYAIAEKQIPSPEKRILHLSLMPKIAPKAKAIPAPKAKPAPKARKIPRARGRNRRKPAAKPAVAPAPVAKPAPKVAPPSTTLWACSEMVKHVVGKGALKYTEKEILIDSTFLATSQALFSACMFDEFCLGFYLQGGNGAPLSEETLDEFIELITIRTE